MCGICGIWNRGGETVDPGLLVGMRDSMAHRGPDGATCVMFDTQTGAAPVLFERAGEARTQMAESDASSAYTVGLGHRRLSIIDLQTGDQPMCNEDGTIWLVFNGEIYNYRELRDELLSRGHVFHSHSDTEVILHAYEEYGEECPRRFNGIFAFALWDARRGRLFLARDHFGVKPLYYSLQGDHFYFGSELKAILAAPGVRRELDANALNLCLTFRHTPSPWTLFKGIYKLPPGSSLTLTQVGMREQRYWLDALPVDYSLSEEQWIERLQAAVEAGVARQMMADVPIALSLSSGIDSTAVLALMSKHSGEPVRAFTVGFAGREDSSEIAPARASAQRFGAEFYAQVITSEDYANFMERYIWHLEEPIGNDSAAAYYFVAEMAHQQGIKVLLNGQGADEAFAGYGRHLWAAYAHWLRLGTIAPLRLAIPRLFGGTALGERYQRSLFTLGASNEEMLFARIYSIISEESRVGLLGRDVLAQMDPDFVTGYVREQLARAPQGTPLERMTYVDTRTSLPDNLLLCEDKMAMAASVEARVPLLDLEFMAIAEQIPGKLKLRGRRDKYIHRKALAPIVGTEAAARPKIGFDNALDLWLKAKLGEQMRAIVSSADSFTTAYLNPEFVIGLMQEHAEGRRDHRKLLFLLLSLESWYGVFMHGDAKVRIA
jgi:asparagine synthase (glutamine-hydrolysing)